jgi:5'-deoxynucleotidase YfbR-like HD superfamily hydrolase
MSTDSGPNDGLFEVLQAAGRLKTLKRAGWVRVGLPEPESVADHSFRVALLAVLFGPRLGLNGEKLVRLALLHDLAEARAEKYG